LQLALQLFWLKKSTCQIRPAGLLKKSVVQVKSDPTRRQNGPAASSFEIPKIFYGGESGRI